MSTKMPKIQPNTPVPYTERHFPWDKRKGAQIWPNGAKMAFVGYVAMEQWDWGHPKIISLTRRPPYNPEPYMGKSTLDTRTQVKYGAEIGIRRIQEILLEEKIPFSMLMTGSFVEDFPEICKEMADNGFEMNAHTWSYSEYFTALSAEEQKATMVRTVDIIKKVTGKTPTGWIGQSATADENTIAACAEMDFLYNADLQDDELPYFIDINGKTLVEVPYRMLGNINDYLLLQLQTMSLQDSLDFMKQSFDRCLGEAAIRPSIFNFGTHPFLIGRPDCASLFREFLQHVKKRDDVWIATLEDVAKWWKQQYNDGYGV